MNRGVARVWVSAGSTVPTGTSWRGVDFLAGRLARPPSDESLGYLRLSLPGQRGEAGPPRHDGQLAFTRISRQHGLSTSGSCLPTAPNFAFFASRWSEKRFRSRARREGRRWFGRGFVAALRKLLVHGRSTK